MNTCTSYQVGNVPVKGEHCAWMESSAVIYCNSVLGARTNTEGRGQRFKGKILVFPGAKGSSGWSKQFHIARIAGATPIAMLFNEMTTKIALGAVVVHAPAITGFDRDPLELIESGDWLKVAADRGIVEVTKKGPVVA